MRPEPATKRVISFFDGQNLFHCAKQAFGYTFPNYDPSKLTHALCQRYGWLCKSVRFYTGVPDAADSSHWNHFWHAKGAQMGRDGVDVFMRPLVYRNVNIRLPDGTTHAFLTGQEKGIDVRLALDVIRLAHRQEFDVALLFCRDNDLSEVADEIRMLSNDQDRWIKIASAFPHSPAVRQNRGINKTDWIKIDRAMYDACIDPRDYRQKSAT